MSVPSILVYVKDLDLYFEHVIHDLGNFYSTRIVLKTLPPPFLNIRSFGSSI